MQIERHLQLLQRRPQRLELVPIEVEPFLTAVAVAVHHDAAEPEFVDGTVQFVDGCADILQSEAGEPANRPRLVATSAASQSLVFRAVLAARAGSEIPSTPPIVWDKIETSMPAASISSMRASRRSSIRAVTASSYSGTNPVRPFWENSPPKESP